MKKILIIEDEETISKELAEALKNAGYNPLILENFKNALEEIKIYNPDLILLDINIPYMNGEILLQNLRKTSNIPVIMVTSRKTEADELISITYGADDYITKPYNPSILLLRINNIFRRLNEFNDTIKYKDIIVNLSKCCIIKGNLEILLTKNEILILTYFLSHREVIVTRDELMTTLWNNNLYINDNALTVNISRLRSKLREVGLENAIETRKGYGYYLR